MIASGVFITSREAYRAVAHTSDVRLFVLGLAKQLRQLGDIRRDPPRLVFGEQLRCLITYDRDRDHYYDHRRPGVEFRGPGFDIDAGR